MHPTHSTLLHPLATLRSLELQAEAERRRTVRAARADRGTGEVRRLVALRRAGPLPAAAAGAIVLPGGTPTR
jgi:hypothetical protein